MVDVTVQWCWAGWIKVDPDPIRVPKPNNIMWTISTPGFSFRENGIVIDPPNDSDFTHQPGSGNKFILHDKHTILSPPLIKYTVRLVRDSDGMVCNPYDPFISNDPS